MSVLTHKTPWRTQVCQLDAYFTDLHWYPLSSKRNQSGGTDVFAVGCTNGESIWTSGALKIFARTRPGPLSRWHVCFAPLLIALPKPHPQFQPGHRHMWSRVIQDHQQDRKAGEKRGCSLWCLYRPALELRR